ncbi:MAG: hemolysin family protein [Clostridiales bacterium]|nr:hemolysin family protein [Clostridiales bacterium]
MEESNGQSFANKLRRLIKKETVRDEEVLAVVKEFENKGVIEADEAELISNVIDFSDTLAGDIMTHRTKIVAVDTTESVETALRYMLDENHSRYPLYDETIDNIVGMVYLKDVMSAYMDGKMDEPVKKFAREALYVPETMPIDNLFEELRAKRTHLAVVIDEYGQTAGIVGMEDIIEELVGEILDEYDEEETYSAKTDGSLSVSGDIKLEELCELLHIELPEEDLDNFDTLNGLLINLLGHIPEKHEKDSISYCGYSFNMVSAEGRVFDEISIIKEEQDTTEE